MDVPEPCGLGHGVALLLHARRSSARCLGLSFFGRPSIRPSAPALSSPTFVLSWIISRSNSAKAPTICIIRPAGAPYNIQRFLYAERPCFPWRTVLGHELADQHRHLHPFQLQRPSSAVQVKNAVLNSSVLPSRWVRTLGQARFKLQDQRRASRYGLSSSARATSTAPPSISDTNSGALRVKSPATPNAAHAIRCRQYTR